MIPPSTSFIKRRLTHLFALLGDYVEYFSDSVNKEYAFVPDKQLTPFRKSRRSFTGGGGSKKMQISMQTADIEIETQNRFISVFTFIYFHIETVCTF